MKLARIFTDHMVLQAGKKIRIFGEGAGMVQVMLAWNTAEMTAKDENWCIELPAMEYGGPYELEVVLDGVSTLLKDVYIGEVWIAAGQSNMEMPLYRAEGGFEEAECAENEEIHFFTVPKRCEKNTPKYGWYFEKNYSEDTPWQLCGKDTALHFSALGYYVVKELHKKLNVHVGVISCNWGGTAIETHISREYFDRCSALKAEIEKYNQIVEHLDWCAYKEKFEKYLNAEGLHCKATKGLKLFIADHTNALKPAKVSIDHDLLIVENEDVKESVLVRYGFDSYYFGYHIYNKAGLPLAPFRTDKGKIR